MTTAAPVSLEPSLPSWVLPVIIILSILLILSLAVAIIVLFKVFGNINTTIERLRHHNTLQRIRGTLSHYYTSRSNRTSDSRINQETKPCSGTGQWRQTHAISIPLNDEDVDSVSSIHEQDPSTCRNLTQKPPKPAQSPNWSQFLSKKLVQTRPHTYADVSMRQSLLASKLRAHRSSMQERSYASTHPCPADPNAQLYLADTVPAEVQKRTHGHSAHLQDPKISFRHVADHSSDTHHIRPLPHEIMDRPCQSYYSEIQPSATISWLQSQDASDSNQGYVYFTDCGISPVALVEPGDGGGVIVSSKSLPVTETVMRDVGKFRQQYALSRPSFEAQL